MKHSYVGGASWRLALPDGSGGNCTYDGNRLGGGLLEWRMGVVRQRLQRLQRGFGVRAHSAQSNAGAALMVGVVEGHHALQQRGSAGNRL